MLPLVLLLDRKGDHLQTFQGGSALVQLLQERAAVLGQREEQQESLASQQQLHRVATPERRNETRIMFS